MKVSQNSVLIKGFEQLIPLNPNLIIQFFVNVILLFNIYTFYIYSSNKFLFLLKDLCFQP